MNDISPVYCDGILNCKKVDDFACEFSGGDKKEDVGAGATREFQFVSTGLID